MSSFTRDFSAFLRSLGIAKLSYVVGYYIFECLSSFDGKERQLTGAITGRRRARVSAERNIGEPEVGRTSSSSRETRLVWSHLENGSTGILCGAEQRSASLGSY